jgi:hypothetical protein
MPNLESSQPNLFRALLETSYWVQNDEVWPGLWNVLDSHILFWDPEWTRPSHCCGFS